MANKSVKLTLDTNTYKDLLSQNVKVYNFDETTNTYKCLGISNVDANGNLTMTVAEDGTYFVTTMDCKIYDENAMTPVTVDAFDYEGTPNSDIWDFAIGNNNGWGNNELEYYSQNNATVNNGTLTLTAKHETTTDSTGTYDYTSAKMQTKKSWTYGKLEVVASMPSAQAGT